MDLRSPFDSRRNPAHGSCGHSQPLAHRYATTLSSSFGEKCQVAAITVGKHFSSGTSQFCVEFRIYDIRDFDI